MSSLHRWTLNIKYSRNVKGVKYIHTVHTESPPAPLPYSRYCLTLLLHAFTPPNHMPSPYLVSISVYQPLKKAGVGRAVKWFKIMFQKNIFHVSRHSSRVIQGGQWAQLAGHLWTAAYVPTNCRDEFGGNSTGSFSLSSETQTGKGEEIFSMTGSSSFSSNKIG